MNTHLAHQTNTATAPLPEHWAQAVELLLAQLVFVLDAEGRNGFTVEKLERWTDICAQRMAKTGSAPAAVIKELQALTARVVA